VRGEERVHAEEEGEEGDVHRAFLVCVGEAEGAARCSLRAGAVADRCGISGVELTERVQIFTSSGYITYKWLDSQASPDPRKASYRGTLCERSSNTPHARARVHGCGNPGVEEGFRRDVVGNRRWFVGGRCWRWRCVYWYVSVCGVWVMELERTFVDESALCVRMTLHASCLVSFPAKLTRRSPLCLTRYP
jgi:hypothetical protein